MFAGPTRNKDVVPKLDLRGLGSRSAPNSARSNKKDPKTNRNTATRSNSQLNDVDPKYLAWKRRKEYKPNFSSARFVCDYSSIKFVLKTLFLVGIKFPSE